MTIASVQTGASDFSSSAYLSRSQSQPQDTFQNSMTEKHALDQRLHIQRVQLDLPLVFLINISLQPMSAQLWPS